MSIFTQDIATWRIFTWRKDREKLRAQIRETTEIMKRREYQRMMKGCTQDYQYREAIARGIAEKHSNPDDAAVELQGLNCYRPMAQGILEYLFGYDVLAKTELDRLKDPAKWTRKS